MSQVHPKLSGQEVTVPELPEVETVVRQLAPLAEGRTVKALRVLDSLLSPGRRPGGPGLVVSSVTRVGKEVVLALAPSAESAPRAHLAVHLRMTGRLLWVPDGTARPPRHLRALLELEGGRVAFVDPRRFGTLVWHAATPPVASGVDPFTESVDGARLAGLIDGSSQALKVWLLRQDRLVGLGNIYASEILHWARLSPFRPAGSLAEGEAERLARAVRSVLEDAVRACGTTFSDFQGAQGMTGSYQRYLAVYSREGESCTSCGASIAKAVQAQRSTFFCARCQDVSEA